MPLSLSTIFAPIRDVLFISDCFHCGLPLRDGEQRICRACWDTLTPVRPGDHTLTILLQRFSASGMIDGIDALCYFEKGKLLQNLAHGLKYQEMTSYGYDLGRRMGDMVRHRRVDVIVPVPLNKRKERERGYNQSDWIARGISDVTGVPLRTDTVVRQRYTVTQTHLNAQQRKENIADAFGIPRPAEVNGRSILIVDDIITTGSTIQEVASVLRNAGASSVYVAAAGLAKLGEDA
jgi:ComF family protein